MAVIGYQRVSTRGQAKDGNGLEAQEKALREAGAEVIFSDAYSGTRTSRPEFDKCISILKPNDTLMVTKLDRVARSASQGMILIQELLDKGIKVHILNMGLLDNSPTGRLIRNILLAFSEFERDMIVERTAEGKSISRLKPGFREGRPEKFSVAQKELALELLKEHSYNETSRMTGISKSTLLRYARAGK